MNSCLSRSIVLRALFVTALTTVLGARADAQSTYFRVVLSGLDEVPANVSSGFGVGHLVLDQGAHTLTYDISIGGLSSAETAAHIHGFAPYGVNAGVLFGLPLGSPKQGAVATTALFESNMLAGLTYVNVHSMTFPGGEIRGQILPIDTPAYLNFGLSGADEVPPNASPGGGSGCVVLDPNTHTLTYSMFHAALTSPQTAAHIHGFAPVGVNAGVLFAFPLGTPIAGTFTTTSAQELGMLNGNTYVNVHTTMFPGGEVRGQITRQMLNPLSPFCFGDGTGTACPCGNASTVGDDAGCLHSFGVPGKLRGSGIPSIACDSLSLDATNLPATTSALFFQGNSPVGTGSGPGAPFGDGLRCIGGSVFRLGTRMTSGGSASYPSGGVPIHTQGAIFSPMTFYYQVWFRNAAAFCTPSTFNLTNALDVNWVP